MTVRIIIERSIRKGKEAEVVDLLGRLRAKAISQHGYIGGETLRAVDEPSSYIVISTWNSYDDWKVWENAAERLSVLSQIEPLLNSPPIIKVYTYT